MQGEKGKIAQANHILNKLEQKEAKGLANVTYNGKNASLVYKDLENIDEAILYAKGTKKKGGAHIRIKHSTQDNQEGYVTPLEVSSLGKNIREFLKYNEPFIDKNGARLYEWEKDNVRFRVVINDIQEVSSGNSHLPSANEEIITFYSDRNQAQMQSKNPSLQDVRRMDSIDTLSPTAKATAKTENVSTSQSSSTIDKALLSKAQSKFK